MGGYSTREYAHALGEFGQPRALARSGGWILERAIGSTSARDAAGCYPLFACNDWAGLPADLADLSAAGGAGLVSLVLVADPFAALEPAALEAMFPDLCIAYKQHFVVDLARPMADAISPHHARNMRRAQGQVCVERCADPVAHLADWLQLYARLIARHEITGIAAFSAASFAAQFGVPGLVVYRAAHGGQTVGMVLWYVMGQVAYYHLGAYSDLGYELRASYALFAQAIDDFRSEVRWLSLGAGAGAHNAGDDGLTRFKRGWATGTRPAYLCGRVFDHARYGELVRTVQPAAAGRASGYFPAYRQGEFR